MGPIAALPVSPGSAACSLTPICAPVQGVSAIAGHLLGGAARSVTTDAALAIFHTLEIGLVRTAEQTTTRMFTAVFHEADVPSLSSSWFLGELGAMAQVTALIVFPLLMAATIGAVVRQDMGRLIRTWLVWLPLAGVLTLFMIPLVQAALAICDHMTTLVTGHMAGNLQAAMGHLVLNAGALGNGLLATLVGGLILLGALAIWLEMVVRSSAILITVFFLPLILAGLVWPATAHVVRRVIEVLVALILSKFVVAAVLCLGAVAVVPPTPTQGRPDVLVGVAILLLAAFAPMALLRLVPILEAATISHLEGRARQPFRAAGDAAGRVHRQVPLMAKMLGLEGQAGSGGGGNSAGG